MECPYDPNDLKNKTRNGSANILNFSLLFLAILALYMI